MQKIVTISGSPSFPSRSSAVLAWVRHRLEADYQTQAIEVRDLPAEAILHGEIHHPVIQAEAAVLAAADAVVIATPVYKASYAGILKAFLDLLPPEIFAGKIVLPIATGGSLAHLLVLDYALGPVLAALGARQVLRGVYLPESHAQWTESKAFSLAEEAEARLWAALGELTGELRHQQHRRTVSGDIENHAERKEEAHV